MMQTDAILEPADAAPRAPEQRRCPRVAMGRPGQLHFTYRDDKCFLSINVIDISLTGCRLLLDREALPAADALQPGTECSVRMAISPGEEVDIPAAVAWSQRYRQGMNLAGLRFLDPAKAVAESLDRFVMGRLRAGLTTEEPSSQTSARWKKLVPLEQPLAVEATSSNGEAPVTYRLLLTELGAYRLRLHPDVKKGECPSFPPKSQLLEMSVFPPAWADVELRSLRFAARVVHGEADDLVVEFINEDHDLSSMIRSLLPPRKKIETPARGINPIYVLIGVGILLAYLILAMG